VSCRAIVTLLSTDCLSFAWLLLHSDELLSFLTKRVVRADALLCCCVADRLCRFSGEVVAARRCCVCQGASSHW
jgi:hypothetical protein